MSNKVSWIDVWNDNYYGRSEAAKNIDDLMKKNYKGHKYVPWAVMQKWLYLMDVDAELEVLPNKNGGLVHIDSSYVDSYDGKSAVKVLRHSFFVVLRVLFMGKPFIEYYPIQDNAYNAPNYVDSNMVNKAIQRAKAKIISAATGLGYSLYEFGDLQFEEDSVSNTKQNVVKEKVTPPKREKLVHATEAKPETKESDATHDLAKYIRDNKDTIAPVLQRINPSMIKKYGKSINPDEDLEDIVNALSEVANIELFGNSIKKQHEELTNV